MLIIIKSKATLIDTIFLTRPFLLPNGLGAAMDAISATMSSSKFPHPYLVQENALTASESVSANNFASSSVL